MYLRTQRNTTSKSTYIIYFESLNSHPPVIFVNLMPIYTFCHQISLDTFYMDFSSVSRLTILFNNGLNMFTVDTIVLSYRVSLSHSNLSNRSVYAYPSYGNKGKHESNQNTIYIRSCVYVIRVIINFIREHEMKTGRLWPALPVLICFQTTGLKCFVYVARWKSSFK